MLPLRRSDSTRSNGSDAEEVGTDAGNRGAATEGATSTVTVGGQPHQVSAGQRFVGLAAQFGRTTVSGGVSRLSGWFGSGNHAPTDSPTPTSPSTTPLLSTWPSMPSLSSLPTLPSLSSLPSLRSWASSRSLASASLPAAVGPSDSSVLDIHELLATIRRLANELGAAWTGHSQLMAEFSTVFRQLQTRMAEVGSAQQQLSTLFALQRDIAVSAQPCWNLEARKLLGHAILDCVLMASHLLRGECLANVQLVYNLHPAQRLALLLSAYEATEKNKLELSTELCTEWLALLSSMAKEVHANLRLSIPNLLDYIPPDMRTGIRANTEGLLQADMAEMRRELMEGHPLEPCRQCLKDLPRLAHVAMYRGEVVYRNDPNAYGDLPPEEALAIRKSLLLSYLSPLSEQSRITTMALLTQTCLNELAGLFQVGITECLGDVGVMDLGQSASMIEMNWVQGKRLCMRFLLDVKPKLLPAPALGAEEIVYGEGSKLKAVVEVMIEADGTYQIYPPRLPLTLIGPS